MAHWAVEVFGDELLTKDGKKATKDAVQDKKAVLVYFSAHWCPPCRMFTPVLAEAYKQYGDGDVEIIFVSSDRDQGSFDEYFAGMPWMAVPFVDRKRKDNLSQKYGVQGIPMLVVLNGDDGQLITANGRGEVQSTKDLGKSLASWLGGAGFQPAASALPGAAQWAVDLFGQFIETKNGKKETAAIVTGKKFVLVYFSAHWCPPCRRFTPMLAETYKKYGNGDIEVVFVSGDRDQGSFDEYFAEMPWTAVPFTDREQEQKLSKKFNIQGIPTLIVLNGEGQLVTEDGRSAVQSTQDLHKCVASWASPPSSPYTWASRAQHCVIS